MTTTSKENNEPVEDITDVQVIPQSAIESVERAHIDMQIATAKRFRRDIHKVKVDMVSLATMDQETAESCFYSLPRGGKTIQGPGVRLAEIAVHSFGNIRVQTRIINTEIDGPAPHVTLQAVCMDLEQNVAVSIEKRRRIVGKKSKGGRIDEDDINLAANAGAAIAFRDAAFKVIPGALIQAAYHAAKKVAIGDAKTLSDRRQTAIERFGKMGVQKDRILNILGKRHEDLIDLEDLEVLYGLFTAIREGATTIEQAFPLTAKEPIEEPSAEKGKPVEKPKPAADLTPPPEKPKRGRPAKAKEKPKAAAPAPAPAQEQEADAPPAEDLAEPGTGEEPPWFDDDAQGGLGLPE